jgi:hypothetical protein
MEIKVNGNNISYDVEKGFAVISHEWKDGDKIKVDFPFDVRIIKSNTNIKENIGKIALQAGPIVYCVEGFDMADGNANNIMLDKNQNFRFSYQKDLLNGLMTINGKAKYFQEGNNGNVTVSEVDFTAIPYYAWANRGGSEMEVWIPETKEAVFPEPFKKIYNKAIVSTSKTLRTGDLNVINDAYIPSSNEAIEVLGFNFWPLNKSEEWIEYTFEKPVKLNKSIVYWTFKKNEIDYPKSWKLYYKKNGIWNKIRGPYKFEQDGKPSVKSFQSIETDAIRLYLNLDEKPAGLYEWVVK